MGVGNILYLGQDQATEFERGVESLCLDPSTSAYVQKPTRESPGKYKDS